MAVKFILGTSGEERSKKIYEYAIGASRDPEKNVIVIVPEQFTLVTQKGLVQAHPKHALLNIDVVSFERLAAKILGKTGGCADPIIRESGKSIIIRKVINECRKDLKFFAAKTRKRGLVSEMKSLVSELNQYGVSPEELKGLEDDFRDKGDERIANKLADIGIIFSKFHEEIKARYVTQEELLDVLKRKLDETQFLKGCDIYFDGFTGFTTTQYRLLSTLIKQADEVGISVAYEGGETHSKDADAFSGNLFFMSDDFMNKVIDIAGAVGKEADEKIFCEDSPTKSKELEFIKHNLFIKDRSGKEYDGDVNDIKITEAADAREEISHVINEIYKLTRIEGYRYRDIAIVAEDLDVYGEMLSKLMEQNGFPCFLDERKKISENAYIEHIRALMEICIKGWKYDNIFRFLKTGFADKSKEEVDILENYCLAAGINSKNAWNKTWDYKTRKRKKGDVLYYDLDGLNEFRKEVYSSIDDFCKSFRKEKTVIGKTEVLKNYLKTNELTRALAEKNEETERVSEKVFDIFDEICDLFCDEKMKDEEFAEILDAAFDELSLGFIPATLDSVTIGDVNRTRLTDIKALFVVGVNDGVLPKKNTDSGILTGADRLKITEKGTVLAPSMEEKSFIQRFYLYLLFTKPFEKLYISFSRKDSKGESILPSFLIKEITEMFPKIKVKEADEKEKRSFSLWLPENEKKWKPVSGSIYVSNDITKLLYGDQLTGSVSSFEKFAGCPFSFFAYSGLKLTPREQYEFNSMDFGNVVHDVLRRVLDEVINENNDLRDISDDELICMTKNKIDDAVLRYNILDDTGRNKFKKQRISELSQRSIKTIKRQIAGGSFNPHLLEHAFREERNLSDGRSYVFKGKIDRIDTATVDNEVYVSVIDYKTGNSKFELTKAYYGRQIQLINYLMAAVKEEESYNKGKEIIPTALLYYNVKNPFIDVNYKTESQKDIEKKIEDNLKMEGILNTEGDAIDLVSSDDPKKTSYYSTSKSDLCADYMRALIAYEEKLMDNMATEILNGKIDINPLYENTKNGDDACMFCEFSDVCNFSRNVPGCKDRKYKNLKVEEIWKSIRKGEFNG